MEKEMDNILRTDEEIQKMIDTLQKEIDGLPAKNIFGDSNAEAIKESKEWIYKLERAKDKRLPVSPHDDVYLWLVKKFSALNDYE
jgi:hypothetical protein